MSLLLLFRAGGSPVADAGAPAAQAPAVALVSNLELSVQITKPDGRKYLWDSHGYSEDVPTGISCSSKRQDGFASASCTLPRRIDTDYPDIELRDTLEIVSASGEVVWDGYVSAAPRSMDDSHSIDVQATGWMGSTRWRKFRQIFVDRQFSSWGEPSLLRQVDIATAGYGRGKIPSSTDGGLTWTPPNELMPISEDSELWYNAGDELAASKIMYRGARTGAFTNFEAPTLLVGDGPNPVTFTTYTLTLDNTIRTQALAAAKQGLMLRALTTASTTPGVAHLQRYDQIAVYGDHGLTTRAISGEPDGVYASDVMEWIIHNYCPELTWAGNDSTYPIPHLAFRDLIHPYDAMLACNAFHLLDLACWEGGKVYWYPVDLTDWDWEIRPGEDGSRVTMEGDSDEDLANGIDIQYPDLLTGETKFLYADNHPELRDDSELNPANRHGHKKYTDATLSNAATEASALQIGRAMLAEFNQPKSPGSYSVQGEIRDRQGNWQPAWKVRATDRIIIANHPNRSPRLVTEAQYSQDSHTVTIATDNALMRMEAVADRLSTALVAANLS